MWWWWHIWWFLDALASLKPGLFTKIADNLRIHQWKWDSIVPISLPSVLIVLSVPSVPTPVPSCLCHSTSTSTISTSYSALEIKILTSSVGQFKSQMSEVRWVNVKAVDLMRSCEILWDLKRSCEILKDLKRSQRILKDLKRSCEIFKDLERSQKIL